MLDFQNQNIILFIYYHRIQGLNHIPFIFSVFVLALVILNE